MKIFDSSPLIAILGNLNDPVIMDKLIQLGYTLYVPSLVVAEVTHNPEKNNLDAMISKKKIIKIAPISENRLLAFRNRYFRLGKGESELILIAEEWQKQNKEFYCIIDDNEARKIAELFKLKCTGTIGLLLRLKEKGLITKDELIDYLKRLEKCGFRFDVAALIKTLV